MPEWAFDYALLRLPPAIQWIFISRIETINYIIMKNISISSLLAAGLAVLLVGCTTSYVLVGSTRPPVDPAAVKVYFTPPKHYEPIALVASNSKVSFRITAQRRTDAALERAKREAARLGANGLLLQTLGQGGSSVGVGFGTTQRDGGNLSATGVGVSSGPLDKTVNAVAIFVIDE